MTVKLRKILFGVFIAAFMLSVFGFALTTARYSTALSPDNNTGELEYTVANQVEIRTVDQFFAAIEHGYPNIKIADGVDNPFLVTGSADVNADLILDLNGHDIQRNNREPMLTIKEGVKMVVTDTSQSKSGSFYNPVGSVLEIDGGVLTVMEGKFESGVRSTEYYDKDGTSPSGNTCGIIAADEAMTVTKKENGAYTQAQGNVPVIVPSVIAAETGAPEGSYHYYVNGNLYFGKSYGTDTGGNIIPADTYLYFTIKDNDVTSDKIVPSEGSADFYYTYYLNKATGENNKPVYTYSGATSGVEVTIYGYYNAVASAKNETTVYKPDKPSNFAAIGMQSGSLYTRGGKYYSHFGVASAYCVYAEGGTMTVINGTYSAVKEGVCISCSFGEDGGNLIVQSGEFLSESGDTIQMLSGSMAVTGGTFIKDASSSQNTADHTNGAAIHISGASSVLNVTGKESSPVPFTMTGSGMCAIDCSGGAVLSAEYVSFVVSEKAGDYGKNNAGVYNAGGKVIVKSCVFDIDSDTSVGIVSTEEGGDVSVVGTEFVLDGKASKGIYQLKGITTIDSGIFSMKGMQATGVLASSGTVNIGVNPTDEYEPENSVFFYIDHIADCYGVLAGLNDSQENTTGPSATDESKVTVNLYSAQFFIGQGYEDLGTGKNYFYTGENTSKPNTSSGVNCAGIFSNLENAKINVTRGVFLVAGSYSAGIYAAKGTIDFVDTTSSAYAHKLALFAGVQYSGYVNGGYRNDSSYKGWIYSSQSEDTYKQGTEFKDLSSTPAKGSYGIASLGGKIELDSVYVYLKSKDASALYSSGGEVKLNSFHADVYDENNGYLSVSVLSVRNGEVMLGDCDVWTDGIGITVEGGSLTITGTAEINSDRSTAVFMNSAKDSNGKEVPSNIFFGEKSKVTVDCVIAESSSTGVSLPWKVEDSTSTTGYREVSHYDAIKINGGSLKCEGDLTLQFQGLENDTSYATSSAIGRFLEAKIKSYAVSVLNGEFFASGQLHITSSVGGGVKVSGGNVTIGNEKSLESEISIATTGNEFVGGTDEAKSYYAPVRDIATGYDISSANWLAPVSRKGGHALELEGGNLTVYNGNMTAELGNGVKVVSNGTINPKITIYNGSFNGKMTGFDSFMKTQGKGFEKATGPGAFYGIKIMGSSTTNIYGGSFYGGNGGMFVTGVTAFSSSYPYLTANGTADVYIFAGMFKSDYDGFNVYDAANVIFGAYKEGEAPVDFNYKNAIQIESTTVALATNMVTQNSSFREQSKIFMYYGTYDKKCYNENADIQVYNWGNDSACMAWNNAEKDGGDDPLKTNSWTGTQQFYS